MSYAGPASWLMVGLGLLLGAAAFWREAGGEWASSGWENGEIGKFLIAKLVIVLCMFGTISLIIGVLSLFRINYRIQVVAGELLFSQRRLVRMRISLRDIAAAKVEEFSRHSTRWFGGFFGGRGWKSRPQEYGVTKVLLSPRFSKGIRLTFVGGHELVFSSARPAQLAEILDRHSKEEFRRHTLQAAGLSKT